MSPGETSAQKEAAKAAEAQKAKQMQMDTAAKSELQRRQDEMARRGGGVSSFVRTGDSGIQGGMLSSVLGA